MVAGKPPFAVRIERRSGYVFVWQGGMVSSLAELEGMQADIEAAMREVGTRTVMFDNRETVRPDEWIRASMWTWLTSHVHRAALLQAVPRNIARAERMGQQNRITLRAFSDEAEAEAWLVK